MGGTSVKTKKEASMASIQYMKRMEKKFGQEPLNKSYKMKKMIIIAALAARFVRHRSSLH